MIVDLVGSSKQLCNPKEGGGQRKLETCFRNLGCDFDQCLSLQLGCVLS